MELLDAALEAGVNGFDCARSYGRAEEVLGRWLRTSGVRDQVVVMTKCGDVRDGRVHIDRRVMLEQLGRSLDALGGCIDLYLLHREIPIRPWRSYIDTLNEARRQGLVRVLGVSSWGVERLKAANRYAASRGLEGFSVSSPHFSLAWQKEDLWGGGCVTLTRPDRAQDRAWYRETQMPVIAYSSLGRGFFSGRFRSGDWEGAERALDAYARKGYLCGENMERLSRAERLAERDHVSVAEMAMRYVFSCGMNLFASVTTLSPERLRMNLRCAQAPLSPEDARFLDGGEG